MCAVFPVRMLVIRPLLARPLLALARCATCAVLEEMLPGVGDGDDLAARDRSGCGR
jgi:hypothetical protein